MALLHPEDQVFQAMLDGWRNQQLARNLGFGTIGSREAVVRRFRDFTAEDPRHWTAADVNDFFTELRAVKALAHTTLLHYQQALRAFLSYLVDPAYGWAEECRQRFGTHPTQVCHEWTPARHAKAATLREPAVEIPPPVAAKILGYTASVMERHAAQAGSTWAGYPAVRSSQRR